MHRNQIVGSFLACIFLFGCSAKVENRGYSNDEEWKKEVIVGKTTKDEVLARLGSPSSRSTFGNESWYYISERKESYAFLKPEIVKQDVFRVEFDTNGLVSKLEDYNENDSKDFAIATRTTPTEGHTLGFIEQTLGNIGRFNSPDSNNNSSTPGHTPHSGPF